MVRYLLLFSDLNLRGGDLSGAEGKLDRALEVCDRSLKRVKSDAKRGEVLSLVSRILYRSGEISKIKGIHTEVIEAQRKNVSYNRRYGKGAGLGKALNNLALAYLDAGEVDRATESLVEARSILEESGDPSSKAFVEASIADVYITRRDHNKAKVYLSAASSYQPKLPSIRGKLRRRTGECWLKIGDLNEAYSDLRDSYMSFRESGDHNMALWVLLDLYRVDMKNGDHRKARDRLQRVADGLTEMKGIEAGRNGLLLQCKRFGYEHALNNDRKRIKEASMGLANAIMETLEPKRSIIYIDQMTTELKDPELILPLMESFEKVSWSRGDRNGSLVVSLRRTSILIGKGDDKGARKLLGTIIKRGKRIGFKKAVRKANSLLAQIQ
jgi:tetratricopeptide (TPR) repeat protein